MTSVLAYELAGPDGRAHGHFMLCSRMEGGAGLPERGREHKKTLPKGSVFASVENGLPADHSALDSISLMRFS
jgi:hypothetical protein